MPPARATLLPTPGLCKSSRLPWRAVLLSAPSKHCARRRLLAHTPKAAGQRAGSLLPPLCAPNAPAGRALELSKRSARCVGRESNPGQLLGRQLCSPLYHQRSTARVAARRRPRARPSILSPPPPHPCPDAPSAGGSAPPPPAPPAATRRPKRASATRSPGIHRPHRPRAAPPRPCGPPALRSPPRPANASPPSPPAGNAGHAASSTQLAKALLHRALGEATSHDDKGTRDPPACTRRGRREPTSPLRQPLGVGAWAGGRPAARSGYGRARPWGRQGGPRSAVATVRPPTTKGSGWSAARAEGVAGS